MKKSVLLVGVLLLALVFVQCGKKEGEKGAEKAKAPEVSADLDALLHPSEEELSRPAPEKFKVVFETSKGKFVAEFYRNWAPHGVDRFYYLVKHGYYNGARFFRVIPDFVAQFGMNGNPEITAFWAARTIPDDPVKQSNVRGTVTFAKTNAPNSRSTQLFINLKDNTFLDDMGFAPIGRVVSGMDVVDRLYSGYGDGPPRGNGPSQARIKAEGNKYLIAEFPKLDYIKSTRLIEE